MTSCIPSILLLKCSARSLSSAAVDIRIPPDSYRHHPIRIRRSDSIVTSQGHSSSVRSQSCTNHRFFLLFSYLCPEPKPRAYPRDGPYAIFPECTQYKNEGKITICGRTDGRGVKAEGHDRKTLHPSRMLFRTRSPLPFHVRFMIKI